MHVVDYSNQKMQEVEEIMRLKPEEYKDLTVFDIYALCKEDFDYAGELDDGSAFAFWKTIDN